MNRIKGNKIIITIIIIVAIILCCTMGYKIYVDSIRNNKLKQIEVNIKDGKYENALVLINGLENINKYEDNVLEKIMLYKSVISDYLNINTDCSLKILVETLDGYRAKYNETLNLEVFDKLNVEINKIIVDSKYIIQNLDEEINKIKDLVNKDTNKAEELLNEFKRTNPKEDVSEVEEAINSRKNEIKKAGELESDKKDSEEQESQEENIINEDNSGSDSESKIARTNASKNSSQLITVVSNGSSYAELILWQKDNDGKWSDLDKMSARLGSGGMKFYGDVYEMDKCTPTGIYSLTEAFGINSNPGSGVAYRVIDGSEYWVDDVDSEYYNTMQFGEANGRWNSAEHLASWPGYYNYSLVIDYNRWPVVSGKSSAIFLHCDMGVATYGCVAVSEQKLINILQWINPSSNPKVILDFSYDNIYNNY